MRMLPYNATLYINIHVFYLYLYLAIESLCLIFGTQRFQRPCDNQCHEMWMLRCAMVQSGKPCWRAIAWSASLNFMSGVV